MHELEVDMWYRCGTCEVQRANVVHDVVGLYLKYMEFKGEYIGMKCMG